jgi:acetyl esterase/lipase
MASSVSDGADSSARPVLHVPAREIPVPASVSPEAQAVLAAGPAGPPGADDYPPLDDHAAWRAYIAEKDEFILERFAAITAGAAIEDLDVDGVPVYAAVPPPGVPDDDRRVYLDIHGGAWIQGRGAVCRAMAPAVAARIGARVWTVDYRMPPEHPYPAGLDDCLTVYRRLLEQRSPEEIAVGGASAGGNLAAALMLRVRDEGLPLPAAVVLSTPATDLTGAGDSWAANAGLDNLLTGEVRAPVELYAAGHDQREPYLSPLFGDLDKGFPPAILLSGTRDRLLSDTVRMHRALRAAGLPAELHVFEAAGHGMFLGTAPEDREHAAEIRRFLAVHWGA